MKYSVKDIRAAGLEACWSKTRRGRPIIMARNPRASTWWAVDRHMWEDMQRDGIMSAFERCTLLGDLFSVEA
jgi:hypothetical protein